MVYCSIHATERGHSAITCRSAADAVSACANFADLYPATGLAVTAEDGRVLLLHGNPPIRVPVRDANGNLDIGGR